MIAAEFVNQFERLLQAQYPHSKSLRTRCSLWAKWDRADFISALQAVYPQISHDTDKTYPDMITDLKFVYDINKPLVEQYFSDQSPSYTLHDVMQFHPRCSLPHLYRTTIGVLIVHHRRAFFDFH